MKKKKKIPSGFYYAGIICKLPCVAFANCPTDNFGEAAANLLQHKPPLCILSLLRVLNFAVEEDIAHSESLPAITSSHILAQSEVSRMRRYRSVLQHLNTSSVWSTKAMVGAEIQGDRKPRAANYSVKTLMLKHDGEQKREKKNIHFWSMSAEMWESDWLPLVQSLTRI